MHVGRATASRTLRRVTSWFCDCWSLLVGVPLEELKQAVNEAAIRVHADRRIRFPATDSVTLPEVRFVFDLDADSEDQARARAAAIVNAAVAGSHLSQAQWTYRVRIVG